MVLVGVKCFVLDTVLDNFFGLHKTSERMAALTTLQNRILKVLIRSHGGRPNDQARSVSLPELLDFWV